MTKKWNPNGLTISNLVAGIMAIMVAFYGKWLFAVILIMGAALFDSMDGRLARRLNATRQWGKELDSLADLISFGVAPATLAWLLHFQVLGWSGYVVAAVFPAAVALRLARFNLISLGPHYRGLPATVAGPVLALIAVFGGDIPVQWYGLILLVLAGGMVSSVKVPKLWVKR